MKKTTIIAALLITSQFFLFPAPDQETPNSFACKQTKNNLLMAMEIEEATLTQSDSKTNLTTLINERNIHGKRLFSHNNAISHLLTYSYNKNTVNSLETQLYKLQDLPALLKSEFSIITDREDAYIKAVFELIIECKQAERFLNYYSRGNFCLLEKVKDKINEIITSQMNPFYFMRLNSPQQNFTLVKDETIFKGDKLYLFLEQGIKLLLTYELHRLCEIVFYNLAKKNSVIFQNILKTLIDCKSIGQSWFDISENCLSDTKNLNKYLQHFFSPEHQKLLVNFLEKIQTSFNRDLFLAP